MDELSVVCGGLGSCKPDADGSDKYVKGDECLENLKDLQRFMRRDHPESRDVFFQLGKWNIVRHDLVPIILNYRADKDLVLNAVKVMVFLTMPVDSTSHNKCMQSEYLRGFKDAFLEEDAVGVIVSYLERPLEHLESGTTTEDDWKLVQLMLTLFRNILGICDPAPQTASSACKQLRYLKDELLERLFSESVMDLLLALLQHMGGAGGYLRRDNFLMLEIFHYIFLGQLPELLGSSEKLAQKQAGRSAELLRALKEKEKAEKRRNFRKPFRHARFGGTYSQIGQDGLKAVLSRNPFQSPLEKMMRKPQIKRGPIKRVAHDVCDSSTSNVELLSRLRDFADQFLASGYNDLMQAIKEDIRRERPGFQPADILNFFHVAEFCTSYQHHKFVRIQKQIKSKTLSQDNIPFKGHQAGPIASTMDEDMFTLVISKWSQYADAAKETDNWAALNISGALLKAMIHMLDDVLKAANRESEEGQQEIRVARILLYKVFYDQTENGMLTFLFQLIKSFDIYKQTRRHLTDLVETTHLVLRLLETITEEDGALRVITKARKSGSRKKNGASLADKAEGEQTEKPEIQDNNVAAGFEVEEVGDLSDSGRGVAPDVAGDSHYSGREITETPQQLEGTSHADTLQATCDTENMVTEESAENGCMGDVMPHPTSQDIDQNRPEDEQGQHKVKEVSLDIEKYARKFSDNTVIRNYCWLLKHYKDNSPATNYYVVRMLERICDDHVLEPLLYQVSLLRIFHEILSDSNVSTSEKYLHGFVTRVIRNMFKRLKSQPLLFVDLLFWKTRKESHNITANYMLSRLGQQKNTGGKRKRDAYEGLGDDEAEVIPGMVDKPQTAMDDALGEDEYDQEPAQNSVLPEQRRMDALGDDEGDVEPTPGTSHNKAAKHSAPDEMNGQRRRLKASIGVEQEEQIKRLFERLKEKRNCPKLISQSLLPEGHFTPAQIGRKLKQLGLRRASRSQATTAVEDKGATVHSDPDCDSTVPNILSLKHMARRKLKAKRSTVLDPSTEALEDLEESLRKIARRRAAIISMSSSSDEDNEIHRARGKNLLYPVATSGGLGAQAESEHQRGTEDTFTSVQESEIHGQVYFREEEDPSLRPACGLGAKRRRLVAPTDDRLGSIVGLHPLNLSTVAPSVAETASE